MSFYERMVSYMLKVGVIGTGSMGQNHVRIYSEIADLISIADSNEKVINDLSAKFNVNGYADYHELLAIEELEAKLRFALASADSVREIQNLLEDLPRDVLASITRYITRKLKLKVNAEKSRVARPWQIKFLGYKVTRIYGVTRAVTHPKTKIKNLVRLGLDREEAVKLGNSRRGLWRISGHYQLNFAMPQSLFTQTYGLVVLR